MENGEREIATALSSSGYYNGRRGDLRVPRLAVSGRFHSVRSRFGPGSVPNLGTETRQDSVPIY